MYALCQKGRVATSCVCSCNAQAAGYKVYNFMLEAGLAWSCKMCMHESEQRAHHLSPCMVRSLSLHAAAGTACEPSTPLLASMAHLSAARCRCYQIAGKFNINTPSAAARSSS